MRALYAFCFGPASLDEARLDEAAGLTFADCGWEDPIRLLPAAGLRAVVSDCPTDRFTGPEAEARLADLTWVLPRAEAHDRVIARAMTAAAIFPLPFGTLFSSGAALAVEAAERRRTLLDFFARMGGREEWAVKALLERERAIEARLAALYPEQDESSGSGGTAAGGRGYLLRQRRRLEAEREVTPWLAAAVADLDAELRRCCESVVVRPARDPVVANRACLLPPGGATALRETIERLAPTLGAEGLDLHCSGPWPLYSFCAGP